MRIEKSGARRGGRSAHRPAPMAEINIIPLVDVVLVLLIIFMATTAFVKETGLDLKLPDAKTGAAASQNVRDLTVALGKGGAMTLDGQITDETILKAALRSRVKRNPKLNLIIKGDAGIPYSRVVRVMDLAREAGLSSVSLGTRRDDGAGS